MRWPHLDRSIDTRTDCAANNDMAFSHDHPESPLVVSDFQDPSRPLVRVGNVFDAEPSMGHQFGWRSNNSAFCVRNRGTYGPIKP